MVGGEDGREAGVWVIAETDDFGTGFVKIVVTGDDGRFVLPQLSEASYDVWIRGYGLADSEPVTAAPGDAKIFGEWGFGRARKQDAKRRTATARVAWLYIVGARRERACRPVVLLHLAAQEPRCRIARLGKYRTGKGLLDPDVFERITPE